MRRNLPYTLWLTCLQIAAAEPIYEASEFQQVRHTEKRPLLTQSLLRNSNLAGHRRMFLTNDISAQIGTLSLVPQDSVKVPVIAAGGIVDARGIAAAFALGAAAVQMATAY